MPQNNNERNAKNFTILSLNILSLPNHIDDLLPFLSSLDTSIDILILTETWLNETNDTPLLDIPNYSHVSVNRKNRRGEGIRI